MAHNHMDFIRSPRSQLRTSEAEFRATKHSRLEMFEDRISKAESWFDRLLQKPIALAICIITAYVAVLATIMGYLS